MKLQPILHNNASKLWCGPAAIATVTGFDTLRVHQCIRDLTHKKLVTGLRVQDLIRVLRVLGCDTSWTSIAPNCQPTFAAWLRSNQHVFSDRPVIVNVTGHYVTVMGRKFIDNHTKEPVFLKAAPHRRCRVKGYVVVNSTDGEVSWKAPEPVKKDWAAIRARAGLLALAEKHGIKVEDHHPGEWWVFPPPGLDGLLTDPYYDEHLAYDAEDRAERIRTYLTKLGVPLPGTQLTATEEPEHTKT